MPPSKNQRVDEKAKKVYRHIRVLIVQLNSRKHTALPQYDRDVALKKMGGCIKSYFHTFIHTVNNTGIFPH